MVCEQDKKIHFIGVGGVGVNALARFALDVGATVSGSDARYNGLCTLLSDAGADIREGIHPELTEGKDAVIFSSAIKSAHAELVKAREQGVAIYERHMLLRDIAAQFKNVVGIAGTHGKTTTTAMLVHILSKCNKKFVGMIGGESVDYGNYVNNSPGEHDIFVTEACEYKRNFLTLRPTVAVVTNVECDHPDCYNDFSVVRQAFDEYLKNAAVTVTGKDGVARDSWSVEIRGSGWDKAYFAEAVAESCRIYADGIYVGSISLRDGGLYNFKNATFAVATAAVLGVDERSAVAALKTFAGVKRRFEYVCDIQGAPVYFDFAHHPTEIRCVLERAAQGGKKILTVFQPHTYSRTKAYFDDFVDVLGNTDGVGSLILMPTYAAREPLDINFDSGALARAITARYEKSDVFVAFDKSSVMEFLSKLACTHDVILFVGAGDIYDLKEAVCAEYCKNGV